MQNTTNPNNPGTRSFLYVSFFKRGTFKCSTLDTDTNKCTHIKNNVITRVEREIINKNEYVCYMAVQLATIPKCIFLQSGQNIPWL